MIATLIAMQENPQVKFTVKLLQGNICLNYFYTQILEQKYNVKTKLTLNVQEKNQMPDTNKLLKVSNHSGVQEPHIF